MKIIITIALICLMGCTTMNKLSLLEYLALNRSSPLFPYIKCKCDEELRIVHVNQLPSNVPKFRLVSTKLNQIDTISVIDGYRVMYAYDNTNYYFANVKVEKSDSSKYDNDKKYLKNSFKFIAESDTTVKILF